MTVPCYKSGKTRRKVLFSIYRDLFARDGRILSGKKSPLCSCVSIMLSAFEIEAMQNPMGKRGDNYGGYADKS